MSTGTQRLRFLSDEWIAAMDDAARTHGRLRDAATELTITIQTTVEDADRPDGTTIWCLVLGNGEASVRPGRVLEPEVSLHVDRETAARIVRGESTAQSAFMAGRLRLGGNIGMLLAHAELLASVGDVFAAVRNRTDGA